MSTLSARMFQNRATLSAMGHVLISSPLSFRRFCSDSGPLQTPLLMDFLNTPEKLNRRLTHLPLGRFGEAIEQAKAVLFLATDESSYVLGHDLLVDGGLSSAYVTAEGQPILPPPKSLV